MSRSSAKSSNGFASEETTDVTVTPSFETVLENYGVSSGTSQAYTDRMLKETMTTVTNSYSNGLAGGESSSHAPPTKRLRTDSASYGIPADNDPDLSDPNCDPENPQPIRFQDISAAAYKIRDGIVKTPCDRSHMSGITEMDISFKKELQQYTGSFKERGARYTLQMLTRDQRKSGVVAASAGNHALALAYHGKLLNIPVVVVMPVVAPLMKINSCVQYGAKVIVMGKHIGEARKIALKIAKTEGLLYINGYDHPHILAGQGTIGLEIFEQVPDVDAIVIPVGGGGLIAGVALAIKTMSPNTLIIGAESENCASFSEALAKGVPTQVQVQSSLADGLSVPLVGTNAFATCRHLVDKMVTVSEPYIALAILRLIELEKTVVEGAGAVGLAAILEGKLPELKGKKVVVPLCGGNIDTTVLGRVIERGLAEDGRLVRFNVVVSDRPGGIAELSALLASLGVSIKDILHERAWLKTDIFKVQVKCICETRDEEHQQELHRKLMEKYGEVHFH